MAQDPVAGGQRVREAGLVNMHAGQLAVSPAMVRELADDQFPGWRHLAVTALASPGTVGPTWLEPPDLDVPAACEGGRQDAQERMCVLKATGLMLFG